MKNDLTIRAWQHDIGCPISITLLSTSDEGNMVWDDDDDDNDEDDNVVFSLDPPNDVSDDPFDSDVDVGASFQLTFAGQIGWHWNHRKEKLEHEYAVTAWALCVMKDVRQDVQQRLNDGH